MSKLTRFAILAVVLLVSAVFYAFILTWLDIDAPAVVALLAILTMTLVKKQMPKPEDKA